MNTDNKQKVLIRSMSWDELENYLCTSDLNGKIIPKNENTWHNNYNNISGLKSEKITTLIMTNFSSRRSTYYFLNKKIISYPNSDYRISGKNSIDKENYLTYNGLVCKPIFRPLIEYKE